VLIKGLKIRTQYTAPLVPQWLSIVIDFLLFGVAVFFDP